MLTTVSQAPATQPVLNSAAVVHAATAAATFTGLVTDAATAQPVPGACVTAFRMVHEVELATACADGAGHYTFGNGFDQPVKLRATATGRTPLWSGTRGSWADALVVELGASTSPYGDFELFSAAGTVAGRISNVDDQPVVGAKVWLSTTEQFGVPNEWNGSAFTGADGRYTIGNVPLGTVVAQVSLAGSTAVQYVPQRASVGAATRFVITDGGRTDISDVYLRGAGLEVRLVDSNGLPPTSRICVHSTTAAISKCADPGIGLVRFDLNLPFPTTYLATEAMDGRYFRAVVSRAPLVRSEMRSVTITLRQAASLITYAVDAATGQRVTSPVCASIQRPGEGGLRLKDRTDGQVILDQHNFCSTADGTLVIGPIEPGQLQIFAQPTQPYGAQWVGADGGSGDRRLAAAYTATLGQAGTIPPIKLDQGGAITGTITDALTGEPIRNQLPAASLQHACAYPFATDLTQNLADSADPRCTDVGGNYTIGNLGPYAWPVQFVPGQWGTSSPEHAITWSGGVNNRYDAKPAIVVAGNTTTLNATMGPAAQITGGVWDRDHVNLVAATGFEARDPRTGDRVAIGSSANFVSLVGMPQHIVVQVNYWSGDPAQLCTHHVIGRTGVPLARLVSVGGAGEHRFDFRYYPGCPQSVPAVKPIERDLLR